MTWTLIIWTIMVGATPSVVFINGIASLELCRDNKLRVVEAKSKHAEIVAACVQIGTPRDHAH